MWSRSGVAYRLGRLGGQLREEGLDLGLAEPAVSPGGTDGADPASGGPPRDGLRVDSEQGGNLTRREQTLSCVLTGVLHGRCHSRPPRSFGLAGWFRRS